MPVPGCGPRTGTRGKPRRSGRSRPPGSATRALHRLELLAEGDDVGAQVGAVAGHDVRGALEDRLQLRHLRLRVGERLLHLRALALHPRLERGQTLLVEGRRAAEALPFAFGEAPDRRDGGQRREPEDP